ncbi:MAG: hypothetical protein NDJ89_02190 [Oligoflexia bacterium]|nr:hypothetical protein [Oligoflexia bacterium]
MKTLTEFPAATLKNAFKAQQDLQTAGKTPEELPQALGEALKLEGDKLAYLFSALELVGPKLNDLKRVVVLSLNEGEKAPSKALQKEDKYFVAEYFPPMPGKGPAGRPAHGGKGKGDKPRGKGKRRGGGRDGEKRGSGRGERRDGDKRSGERGERRGPTPKAPAPVIQPKGE